MRAIECPNCGAPATNHQNCNFCGSLLVRFADKGIDLSTTSYLNNDAVLPGLINQLKKNLSLQESGKTAATDLYINNPRMELGKSQFCFVTSANGLVFQDGQPAFPDADEVSLATDFVFNIYQDKTNSPIEIERHNRFKTLASFPLFTPHTTSDSDNNLIVYEYAINFGKDIEGTARLISEISNKVFDLDLSLPIDCYTNEYEEVLRHRESIGLHTLGRGLDTLGQDGINWKKWVWIGIAIVGGLIYLFS